jgi:hypothetical protein
MIFGWLKPFIPPMKQLKQLSTPIIAKTLALTGFAALSLIHTTPAQAINIDFQSLEQVNAQSGIVLYSYTEKGFSFDSYNSNGTTSYFGFEGTLSPRYQGSTALSEAGNDFNYLTQVGGGAFDLASIDLTGSFDLDIGRNSTVNFTGIKTDFSTVTQSFTTDDLSGFQTFTFNSDFTNLIVVEFSDNSFLQFDFQLDNVNVTPAVAVPWETDALPVVGSTVLFGLGIWGKRKLAQKKNNKD